MPGGVPTRKPPAADGHGYAIHEVLYGYTPIGKPIPCQANAGYARKDKGQHGEQGGFAHPHIAKEPSTWRRVEGGDDETQKRQTG